MEFGFIIILTMSEIIRVPVLGIIASCSSPAVLKSENAVVNCSFDANIKDLQKDFQVDHYSSDAFDSTQETVLVCYWNNGASTCKIKEGYEFDGVVSNHFSIKIPHATSNYSGRYACQTIPSEPGDIVPCYLYIIDAEPASTYNTILIAISVFVGLLIGLCTSILYIALCQGRPKPEWLRKLLQLSPNYVPAPAVEQKIPLTPDPNEDDNKSPQQQSTLPESPLPPMDPWTSSPFAEFTPPVYLQKAIERKNTPLNT